MAVSPDGQTVLSGGFDHSLLLWDIESGEMIERFAGPEVTVRSVAFSPDGRTALAGMADTDTLFTGLILWDIDTGEEIRRFEQQQTFVLSVALDSDGRNALYVDVGKVVVLRDIETGEILRRFEGHTSMIRSVVFSPYGRMALSASEDGTVRFWHLSLEALFEWIDANLHVREFTCQEREQYRIEPLCGGSGGLPETDP